MIATNNGAKNLGIKVTTENAVLAGENQNSNLTTKNATEVGNIEKHKITRNTRQELSASRDGSRSS